MAATRPFDPAEYLDTPEAQAEFLTDALETGDAGEISHALGVVARARGMTSVAEATGVARESLYRALQRGASPKLDTAVRVASALGLKLIAVPVSFPDVASTPPSPRAEDKLA